ncbi:Protein kinase domain-containing protein [Psidium guajava]|nr:Protein kinase domain-containing protein [Psidium guajava]
MGRLDIGTLHRNGTINKKSIFGQRNRRCDLEDPHEITEVFYWMELSRKYCRLRFKLNSWCKGCSSQRESAVELETNSAQIVNEPLGKTRAMGVGVAN